MGAYIIWEISATGSDFLGNSFLTVDSGGIPSLEVLLNSGSFVSEQLSWQGHIAGRAESIMRNEVLRG